ncbi:hypothetical protein BU23DRAFT_597656 [Bimuria novae-zelandiae CBS 107.79]|uniref:Uncharacterized protein n=1 Tax=Bimuria novae-zelandiae CBS 107.79 TaxID=1447943 RepID=A0A6A5VGE4_9PLEO|nr:hypothetical protein BU23DRAFT_597656 [Bimuria novae-zelandiae CBS 107.79]
MARGTASGEATVIALRTPAMTRKIQDADLNRVVDYKILPRGFVYRHGATTGQYITNIHITASYACRKTCKLPRLFTLLSRKPKDRCRDGLEFLADELKTTPPSMSLKIDCSCSVIDAERFLDIFSDFYAKMKDNGCTNIEGHVKRRGFSTQMQYPFVHDYYELPMMKRREKYDIQQRVEHEQRRFKAQGFDENKFEADK